MLARRCLRGLLPGRDKVLSVLLEDDNILFFIGARSRNAVATRVAPAPRLVGVNTVSAQF